MIAMRRIPRSLVSRATISSVSWLYDALRLTMLFQPGSRRNAAPVKGAIYGTPASAATGAADLDVGVPTAPISANTPSSSISR